MSLYALTPADASFSLLRSRRMFNVYGRFWVAYAQAVLSINNDRSNRDHAFVPELCLRKSASLIFHCATGPPHARLTCMLRTLTKSADYPATVTGERGDLMGLRTLMTFSLGI